MRAGYSIMRVTTKIEYLTKDNFTFDYRRADRRTVAYRKVTITANAMEFRERKVNLSFSIENILREDFPHRQRTNVVNLPTVRESGLQRWTTMPLYRCYTVRYSPIFMKSLPSMYKVEGRLHRVSEGKEQIPPEQEKKTEDHCLSCKDEALRHSGDEIKDKEVKKSETCVVDKVLKRKRRNRSHFTQRQLQYLEKIFSRQQYLTRDERTLLARGLEMTELQIRNWFQNQRYQKKHRANENAKQTEPDSPVSVKSEV